MPIFDTIAFPFQINAVAVLREMIMPSGMHVYCDHPAETGRIHTRCATSSQLHKKQARLLPHSFPFRFQPKSQRDLSYILKGSFYYNQVTQTDNPF